MNKKNIAFHSADKTKVRAAAVAAAETLGLLQSSVNSSCNPYKTYDLYRLLEAYVNEPEKRLDIHRVIGISTGSVNDL